MTSPDERPILLCRVYIPPRMQGDVDAWMPKHFDDSLRHPSCVAAASYEVIHDWSTLPALFNNECTRFIPYVAESLEGLIAWVNGPELRGAIEDGVEREGQYPTLEDEAFNGSIVAASQVRGAVGREFAGWGPALVERFHVPDDLAGDFDAWLDGPYLDGAAGWPQIVRVRTFRAAPGIPQEWPYTRYQGKGNRMLMAELEEGADIRAIARSDAVQRSLADSTRWDRTLSYVRRDACQNLLVRTKADIGT